MVRVQQHLVPQPKTECGHDHDQVMRSTARRQEVFREASLLMKIRGLSVRNAENWAAASRAFSGSRKDAMLFGTLISSDA